MIRAIRERLATRPSRSILVLGALAWGLLMGTSAALKLWLQGWQTPAAILAVALIFAAGGLLAFPMAVVVASLAPTRPQARFAAALVAITQLTAGATAGIYALQYRLYYSEWHGPPFSVGWTYQLVFTIAAAVYQFLVLGVRLYFPIAFACLLVAAYWFATRALSNTAGSARAAHPHTMKAEP
jgi:hypothetical protein